MPSSAEEAGESIRRNELPRATTTTSNPSSDARSEETSRSDMIAPTRIMALWHQRE
ncbi:unannotated protein [freshwater metagenome]|uniref:Unannotated protein n=1 Tax=freshwater metagenome TaxID=449393 RepID=A0A6J6E878_9ZZZZ